MVAGAVTAGTLLLTTGVAGAAQSAPPDTTTVEGLGIATNILWVVIGAVLVIFMQAGFALVETGFCRAKHAAHVVSTNFAIFGLGFVGLLPRRLLVHVRRLRHRRCWASPRPARALIGSGNWTFLWWSPPALGGSGDAYTAGLMAFFLYMVAFMDTTATIPTGAMAERWKWKAFVGWGLFCGAIYYPLFGAWTWGGGWLASLGKSINAGFGYVDFAGSGVVHAMGGVAALAGAIVLGPRLGKYGKDGKPRTLAAHHIPMAMLGTFILLFGWFGFNAASTLAATDIRFAVVAANTAIAGAFGATIAMFWVMLRTGKPDPGHDGQRHAGRPRRHHGAVRLRAAVGGRRHRHHRRCHRHRGDLDRRAPVQDRRSRSAPSRCTACAASSACSASASSPTASTAPGGTAPTWATRASPASSTAAPAGASSAPRSSAP